jgi:hypothetical protein
MKLPACASNYFIGEDFPFLRLRMGQGRGAVRFAPIEVRIVHYPEDLDNDVMWWSNEDKVHSQQVMMRDVIRCSSALTEGIINDGSAVENHIIHCVGLEQFLSRNAFQRCQAIRNNRAEHVRTVLEAQSIAVNDEAGQDDVARVARASSKASRERARKIASLTAAIV